MSRHRDARPRPRLTLAGLLAAVAGLGLALAAAPAPARAQMQDALGKPLPASDLPDGTVTVRLIKGDPAEPYVGTDVILSAGQSKLTARTDAEGRATFPRTPAATELVASARTPEGEVTSDPFSLPEKGGVRLMLSPVPWKAEAGGPMGGGAGGRPQPRQMSGIPRPEQANPQGTLTVRVVYDDLGDNAIDVPVVLVGYASDGAITTQVARTDKAGRARFDKLVLGRTAYYASALVPRDDVFDRLVSNPVQLARGPGIALMLSAEKRGSKKPALDELSRYEQQGVPAGRAMVRLNGAIEPGAKVELLDPSTMKVLATSLAVDAVPNSDQVAGTAGKLNPDAQLGVGALSVMLVRRSGGGLDPIPSAKVSVRPVAPPAAAGATPPAAPAPLGEQSTATSGVANFVGLPAETPLIVTIVVHGKTIESPPINLPKASGGRIAFTVRWQTTAQMEAAFDALPGGPETVYVARIRSRAGEHFSSPFQVDASRGAAVNILVLPTRILFRFHLGGIVDDVYLGFRGMMSVENWSYAPYDPGPEGLVIPLPAGFVGAVVGDEDKEAVAVDKDRGFLVREPIPPGSFRFQCGFSLEVHDGAVDFAMDLPNGSFQSSLSLLYVKGMDVVLPEKVKGSVEKSDAGQKVFTVPEISIRPGTSMTLQITGLPQEPPWRRWVRWGAGAVVALFVLAAAAAILSRRRGASGADEEESDAASAVALRRQRDRLLAEIVRLERDRKSGKLDAEQLRAQRGAVEEELIQVYAQLDARLGPAAPPPPDGTG
jgi:hypothetical protein